MPYDLKLEDRGELRRMKVAPTARTPRWVFGSAAVTVFSSIAAVICARLLSAGVGPPVLVDLAAVGFASLAIGFGVAAVMGRQVHGATLQRLDLLNQALETSANAHLIVGTDGEIAYANAAFYRFFPGLEGPPLDALTRRLAAEDGVSSELASLWRDVTQKGRASGRVAISHPAGPIAWFSVTAHQLAGQGGLSLWNFEDVTQRYLIDREIRDERSKLADFLDHAPIGFYSVDGGRAVPLRQRDLGRLARRLAGRSRRQRREARRFPGRAGACRRAAARAFRRRRRARRGGTEGAARPRAARAHHAKAWSATARACAPARWCAI